jgi:uncharacterized Zn finger protein
VKGRRLLTEGRVRMVDVRPHRVVADVRGGSAKVYRVCFAEGLGWTCSCPTIGRCSHIVATQLVVIVDDENDPPAPEVDAP